MINNSGDSISINNNNSFSNNSNRISFNNFNNNILYNSSNNKIKNDLFLIIFRNIILKKKILYFLKLYNLFYSPRRFLCIKSLNDFPFKSYLNQVDLDFKNIGLFNSGSNNDSNSGDVDNSSNGNNSNSSNNNVDDSSIIKLNQLPSNIESVKILSFKQIEEFIPNNIKAIELPFNKSILKAIKSSSNSNLNTLRFHNSLDTVDMEELKECLVSMESLTELKLMKSSELVISRDNLPNNLKKLIITDDGNIDILALPTSSLPDSLQELTIACYNPSKFQIHSNLLKNHKGLQKLNISSIYSLSILGSDLNLPNSLTSLSIKIKELSFKFPPNLQHLYLTVESDIKEIKISSSSDQSLLPNSLKTLEILCNSIIDCNGNSILPNSLTSLKFLNSESSKFGGFNQQLLPHHLPSNLISLTFTSNSYGSFQNGNQPLVLENIFPSSLTEIDFGAFNQVIGENILRNCNHLKKISFGYRFNQVIPENLIPSSVELLEIWNDKYEHLIQLSNLNNINNNNHRISYNNNNNNNNVSYNNKFLIKCHNIYNYLDSFKLNPNQLQMLYIPTSFKKSLLELELKDKVNLHCLEYNRIHQSDYLFNDLTISNQIKTLVLNFGYNQIINLDQFTQLEDLIIIYGLPKIITSINTIDNCYNFYNLKNIYVKVGDTKFIDSIDSIYFPFIKLIK